MTNQFDSTGFIIGSSNLSPENNDYYFLHEENNNEKLSQNKIDEFNESDEDLEESEDSDNTFIDGEYKEIYRAVDVFGEDEFPDGHIFTTKEVAKIFQTTTQTIRNDLKYLDPFIGIQKNDKGRRAFTKNNIKKYRELIKLKLEKDWSMSQLYENLTSPSSAINAVGNNPIALNNLAEAIMVKINAAIGSNEYETQKMIRSFHDELSEKQEQLISYQKEKMERLEEKNDELNKNMVKMSDEYLKQIEELRSQIQNMSEKLEQQNTELAKRDEKKGFWSFLKK